jgi:hypothetical protein
MLPVFLLVNFILCGCAGLPEFPTKDVYLVDVAHGVCAHYQYAGLNSDNNIIWKLLSEDSLGKCNGNVSLAPKDFLRADDWRKTVQRDYTCKRKDAP